MLTCRNIAHCYGHGWSMQDIDLEVRQGELLALVGPNGAGKTTLLRALARLLRPTSGGVFLEGIPVWALNPREFARKVAFAPQNEIAAPRLKVRESVGLGRAPHRGWFLPLTKDDQKVVSQTLDGLGLDKVADRFINELSGGEQRRVTLARALVHEPRVLLLDEPTVHLDLKHRTDLCRHLRRLAHEQGLAVVLTLHDLNEASCYADRVAILTEGLLATIGPPSEVMTTETIGSAYDVEVTVQRRPDNGRPWITVLAYEGN